MWSDQGVKPAALDRQPDLPYYLVDYVKVFSILSTRRQPGFSGIGPIPMADILAYAKAFRLKDLERFVHHIVCMDNTLIKFHSDRQKALKNG